MGFISSFVSSSYQTIYYLEEDPRFSDIILFYNNLFHMLTKN